MKSEETLPPFPSPLSLSPHFFHSKYTRAPRLWEARAAEPTRTPLSMTRPPAPPSAGPARRPRGEVAEVRAALAALSAPGVPAERAARTREVFKKIVHHTTVGIDLSDLFMQVRAGEEERDRGAWPLSSFAGGGKNQCASFILSPFLFTLHRSSPPPRPSGTTSC